MVGICNPWSELVTCNLHLRGLAEAVKRGVAAAGGMPLEFPTISLGENLMKPTAMLFRNLMSMDVEECIRAFPLDAVVLICGCDKTVPAQLMGALSADVPAIALTAGPAEAATWRGQLSTLQARLEHDSSVSAAAFSPDGRAILTCTARRGVWLWDVARGE